jgi:uncharacterized protein YjbJ (UPF0337 family)
MDERRAETGARGVVEGLKGWTKRVFGQLTGRDDLAGEGRAQQERADAEREAFRHETEAARARAEAEAEEIRQGAIEESKRTGP